MNKKILALILCVLIVISMIPYAVAAGTPTMSVSSQSAKPGETVVLDVSISNNPGINTFSLGINYDTTKLSLTTVQVDSNLGGQFTYSKKAVWLNSADTNYNGKILSLTFKVLDNVSSGDANVAVTYNLGDISNYNEDDISFSLVSGKVTIKKEAVASGTISVGNATAKPGETVTVPVSIAENPGINTFSLGFNYDTTKLELKSVQVSSNLGGQFAYSKKAVWLNSTDSEYNGEILTLTFKVLDNAEPGDTSVAVNYSSGDISNYNEDDVDFNLVPGSVAITVADQECTHNNTTVTNKKEPTCTDNGYSGDTVCASCGVVVLKGNVVNALGHDFTEEIIDSDHLKSAASCKNKAVYYYDCSRCNTISNTETYSYGELGSHKYVDTIVNATCTTEGYTTHTCSICNNSYIDNTTEKLAHQYVSTVTPPTASQKGYTTYVCTNCGYSYISDYTDPVISENSPAIVVESTKAKAGTEVTVSVSIENNVGISGLILSLEYDNSVLTLKNVQNGSLFSSMTNGSNIVLDSAKEVTADGEVIKLTFAVKEDIEGEYPVNVLVRQCINDNFDDVDLVVKNGKITVFNFIYGDANNDDKIDMKDVVLIRKYLAAYDYDTNSSTIEVNPGADANADGKVDMKDVVLLRKYLAAFDYDTMTSPVILGPAK